MIADQEQTPINPILILIIGIVVALVAISVIYFVYNSQEACRMLLDIIYFMGPLATAIIPSYGGAFPC